MMDFIKKIVLAGTGLAMLTTEKIQEMVDELVKKGEVTEKEAREVLEELVEKSKQARKNFEEKVEHLVKSALNRMDIPTKKDLDDLKERLERLEKAYEHKE